MNALVNVMEEVLRGERLVYVERTDLRCQVRGAAPTDRRKAAVDALRAKGFLIVSANIGDLHGKSMRVIVKQPKPALPAGNKAQPPVYQGESLPPRRR